MNSDIPWRRLMAGILFGMAVGLVAFLGFPSQDGGHASSIQAGRSTDSRPAEMTQAPDFNLQQLDGRQVSLSNFRGKVVLLNFWATWCAPCRLEMPSLQDRYDRYQAQGFVVLAVNDEEPAADVESYVQELGLSFPVLLDPTGEVQQLYAIRGYPSSYLIDRDGTIHLVQIGLLAENTLDRSLAELGLSS